MSSGVTLAAATRFSASRSRASLCRKILVNRCVSNISAKSGDSKKNSPIDGGWPGLQTGGSWYASITHTTWMPPHGLSIFRIALWVPGNERAARSKGLAVARAVARVVARAAART